MKDLRKSRELDMVRITDPGLPWDGMLAQVVALGKRLVKVQLTERYDGDTLMAQFASQGADPGLHPNKLTIMSLDDVRAANEGEEAQDLSRM